MGFAAGARAIVRKRLTLRMCRRGLRLSGTVLGFHVLHSVTCSGDNCASECSGDYCGRALPSLVPCLCLWVALIVVGISTSTAHSCKWHCHHNDRGAADGVPHRRESQFSQTSDTTHVSSWFAVGGDGGGLSRATGAKTMVHELLTIPMCFHGFWLLATAVVLMCLIQMIAQVTIARRSATGSIAAVRYPHWCHVCAFRSH
jgi:hypothetical protein